MTVELIREEDLKRLEEYVTETSVEVEGVLDKIIPAPSEDEESRLFEAMRYSVFSGGKRLRPVLLMATNDIFGGSREHAARVAAAIESLHTYSLVHDDLPCMDDDDLRRGKPTCHKQFDEVTAVLAGDALQTLAFDIMSDERTHPQGRIRASLVSTLAKASGAQGMVGGQMIDMLAEDIDELDQGALARLQRKKTGALFSACCECGLILNEDRVKASDRMHLMKYARNIGLAFQMVDDILDEIGNEEEVGKRVRKDAERGKATFASLLGVEGAQNQARMLCEQAIQNLTHYGPKADILRILAQFVVARGH